MDEAQIKSSDIIHMSADGASNAIGSANDYELLTRKERTQDLDFDTCYAHQNQRSGGYASGTVKFAEDPNPELGALLKKQHRLHVHVSRSAPRLKLLRDNQEAADRDPVLNPNPCAETRWDGIVMETKRTNLFMGDFSQTLAELVEDVIGLDYDLLTAQEKSSGDKSNHLFSETEKECLRQYEGATRPAHRLNKFLQATQNAVPYVLFESRLAVQDTDADSFAIHPDVSHMTRTTDLRKRGDMTVLITSSSTVSLNDNRNYTGESSNCFTCRPSVLTHSRSSPSNYAPQH